MESSIGERMARVRNRGTAPELEVRRLLSQRGVRYRLHRRDLPGTPDVYIPCLRLAIFVNGCFWHGHGCSRAGNVKTNIAFWEAKIAQNVARDHRSIAELFNLGIQSVSLWTCRGDFLASECERIARCYRRVRSLQR
jgi:DNA mismatch endonuclease (patch repair protein)